jgi:YebC/PmpR family DNA-binding regulatory protein
VSLGSSAVNQEKDMGRIFETRKATMFARWNKMAKAFTRVARELTMAAKAGGPNAESNPNLRRAIQNARAINMPKDKIDNAIKLAAGKDTSNYEELVYEGYAPHGIAVLVVAATDNPTRTVANVRMRFSKHGGNMGASGSVGFNFQQMGVFRLDPAGINQDELELELIDHGLEEMGTGTSEKGEPELVIRCALPNFGKLQAAIEAKGLKVVSAQTEYVPLNPISLPEEQATEALQVVDWLEQDEDVQHVFHNLA